MNTGRDIVVIGASAGGLQVVRRIISGLPAELNAAIFVCMHVAADRPSLLPKILGACGAFPAGHPVDGESIRRGRIYVAPPDNHLLVARDAVRVIRGPQENRFRPAIDALFRSAARAHGPRVIGVVLTGQLDDGTVGLQAIKDCGGVTIVQDPDEAEHASMPRSALKFVEIDHCLPLDAIPGVLTRLVAEPPGPPAEVPTYVEVEGQIAEQQMNTAEFLENVERIGERTTYACPLCNGSIWQIESRDPLRFRCHVGHSFTAEFFWAEQSQNLENALWSAIRIMEEKVTFARQFAQRMRNNKLTEIAERYEKSANEIDAELKIIRAIIVGGRGTTQNVFEEHARKADRQQSS